MATKKRQSKPDEPKPNREQRRREKFGGHRSKGTEPWPASEPNPAFGGAGAGAENEAQAGRPDQDQTKLTGPGTGGATEQEGRVPRHEGTHATNSAKG
jgi:hypothetical protein